MKQIQFNNVSKCYRLGLTRISVPKLISGWMRNRLKTEASQTRGKSHLWALRDVSFDLDEGQSLALVGPNGAGKTTVLKLLANVTRPTSGGIEVNGRLSALIELGAGFHPDLTGRENIFLNGSILGLKRKEISQRFDEIVEFSELEDFIETPVKRYSSGMIVRLGFSVAACIEPDILLVDEVLAVGDASFRKKCVDRIKELLQNGTSIVFVSHNLWLVQAVCKEALYINKGRLLHRGPTAEVTDHYDRDIQKERTRKLQQVLADEDSISSEVEITSIDVTNSAAVDGEGLSRTSPAEITVHYLATRNVGPVSLVVRILRSDGLTCSMMRSKLDGFGVSLVKGTGTVSISLGALQLYGGSYFAQAMIRDESDSWSFCTATSAPFYVEGSVLTHSEMHGVFVPDYRWRQMSSGS